MQHIYRHQHQTQATGAAAPNVLKDATGGYAEVDTRQRPAHQQHPCCATGLLTVTRTNLATFSGHLLKRSAVLTLTDHLHTKNNMPNVHIPNVKNKSCLYHGERKPSRDCMSCSPKAEHINMYCCCKPSCTWPAELWPCMLHVGTHGCPSNSSIANRGCDYLVNSSENIHRGSLNLPTTFPLRLLFDVKDRQWLF